MNFFLLLVLFSSYAGALPLQVLSQAATDEQVIQKRWIIARELSRYMNQYYNDYLSSLNKRELSLDSYSTLNNSFSLFKDNAYAVFELRVSRSGPTVEKINNFIGWWESHKIFDEGLWEQRCKSQGNIIFRPVGKTSKLYANEALSYYDCSLGRLLFLD